MNIDLISKMIESSPDRERIELDLTILFGEKDIRKIHHPNLDVFIEDVLPRLREAVPMEGDEYKKFVQALHQSGNRDKVISILTACGLLPEHWREQIYKHQTK